MDELIRIEGLDKRYDEFSLSDFRLVVKAGYVVGLIGSNGAGKTTLIKALLGMITPDRGTIRLLGSDPNGSGIAIDKVKQRTGIVLDACAFPVTMSVQDVGTLGRAAYQAWDAPLFKRLCSTFALTGKKPVKDLSRGMGMKLTLAFALAHHPELLILDEATAGLDPMARDEILDIIRDFMAEESHAVLITSHITTDLEKIADEVVCIDDGRIVFDLDKEAITDQAGIAHCREADLDAVRHAANGEVSENRGGSSPNGAARPSSTCALALKAMRRGLGVDVLVSDRIAFSREFPSIEVERASIEDYMTFILKGETL